ncbi:MULTISPECIES: hypothetical protein [Methylomonas]|uniref:PEP-CTERM sorting domain-containing protein n=1 Tax=Methylomonas koyamae TaxID=702114 RepID=A0A177N9P1_9GAMM|nr:hypothetical protein [Methylomonas koyamae]OAI14203.1 hypothetical protein A1355_12695 [Methylomonas koyamae]
MSINKLFETTLLASALTLAFAQPAAAAWTGNDNSVELGTTITNPAFNGSTVGFSGNPALTNDAWGMQAAFTNFYLPTSAQSVIIDARSSAGNYPAFSIFRTNVAYSGDTVGVDTPAEVTGQIHKFNSVGQAGDPGIIWATGPDGIVETLGYVSSSSNNYVNSYGGVIDSGAHDISNDDLYETGVTGAIGVTGNPAFATTKRYATLTLTDLQAGWYAIFVGGADIAGTGGDITVKVTASAAASTYTPPAAVPVPAAVWLFGSALVGFLGLNRKSVRV